MNSGLMCEYIKFCADRLLGALGCIQVLQRCQSLRVDGDDLTCRERLTSLKRELASMPSLELVSSQRNKYSVLMLTFNCEEKVCVQLYVARKTESIC